MDALDLMVRVSKAAEEAVPILSQHRQYSQLFFVSVFRLHLSKHVEKASVIAQNLALGVAEIIKEITMATPADQVNDGSVVNFDPVRSELEYLNQDLDGLTLEEDFQDLATVQAHGRQSFVFLQEDEEFQRVLAEGGENPSTRADRWATNRLNSFREFKGLDSSLPFYEMPPLEIVALLKKFFEQVCKLDRSLYPSQSLMSLYRAFHRMIRKHQDLRIQRTGIEEPIHSLKDNPVFKPIGVACVTAMARSRNAGVNLPRKKASVISMADESIILGHAYTSPTHPRGLQKRAAYYMLSRFCIRGGSELYNLHMSDFRFGVEESGDRYVRYDERLSKNYKVSLQRYQEEHFRPAITEYNLDVVLTMELLHLHLPTSILEKDRFLFHQAIDNPRTVAWYSSTRVSQRNLGTWLKQIHTECGLLSDGITNKSERTTCVTCMSVEGVPPAVGMLITGHKSVGGYSRYDRTSEAKVKAAQKCIAEGTSFNETIKEETTVMKVKLIQGSNQDGAVVPTVQSEVGSSEQVILVQQAIQQQEVGQSRLEVQEPQYFVQQPYQQQPVHHAVRNAMHLIQRLIQRPYKRQSLNPPTPQNVTPEPVPPGDVLSEESGMVLPEMVSVQSTEEYDEWADMVNWEEVERDLTKNGVMVAKTINTNPITVAFGKIQAMNNCNVTINFNSGGGSSGFGNAFGPTDV